MAPASSTAIIAIFAALLAFEPPSEPPKSDPPAAPKAKAKAEPPKRRIDLYDDVQVMPSSPKGDREAGKSARKKGQSESDREVAVESLPSWKKAEFFGMQAEGQFFVFVVDCSGSMTHRARLFRAKQELSRAVQALKFPQRFHVIFYNETPRELSGGPYSADQASKRKLDGFLRQIPADGQTDPRAAMRQAIQLEPDAIFLLSDGEYPAGAADAVIRANAGHIPIHCIDLSGGAAGPDLMRISHESGGRYAARP